MKKNKETQAFLSRALEAEREIKRLKDRIKRYREMAEGMGGMAGGTGGSKGGGGRSKMEEAVANMMELEEAAAEKIRELTQEIRMVEEVIQEVKKDKYREVLERKYLSGQEWLKISSEMKYTDEKSVYKVHGWAVEEVRKIREERERKQKAS